MTCKDIIAKLEIAKVLVCSTAHFRSSEDCSGMPDTPLTSFDTEFGMIVVIPYYLKDAKDREVERILKTQVDLNIIRILKFAASLDCWAVNFDSDGDKIPTFETYEW